MRTGEAGGTRISVIRYTISWSEMSLAGDVPALRTVWGESVTRRSVVVELLSVMRVAGVLRTLRLKVSPSIQGCCIVAQSICLNIDVVVANNKDSIETKVQEV